jgi:hypothetical protein
MNENDIWTIYFPIGFGTTMGLWGLVQAFMFVKKAAEVAGDAD